jgi:hypothetical protein
MSRCAKFLQSTRTGNLSKRLYVLGRLDRIEIQFVLEEGSRMFVSAVLVSGDRVVQIATRSSMNCILIRGQTIEAPREESRISLVFFDVEESFYCPSVNLNSGSWWAVIRSMPQCIVFR